MLTVSELRAVIAHEMGHFSGGDIRLGPRIYRTRNSLVRTLGNLARFRRRMAGADIPLISNMSVTLLAIVQLPFAWFATGFMRITQAVSRAQELTADRLAAQRAGTAPAISALEKTDKAALAHVLYMRTEIG